MDGGFARLSRCRKWRHCCAFLASQMVGDVQTEKLPYRETTDVPWKMDGAGLPELSDYLLCFVNIQRQVVVFTPVQAPPPLCMMTHHVMMMCHEQQWAEHAAFVAPGSV